MPRFRITIEYDGTPFVGWQSQSCGGGVQDHLQRAIFNASGETVSVRGAGRTDSGVHALGQVGHFDLSKSWDPFRLREALNHHLKPEPVAVIDAVETDDEFDARHSATARHYLYRILSRRAPPTVDRERVWWVPTPLDHEAMHHAAQELVGHHDFTTFRASGCQAASPEKTLDKLDVSRYGDEVHIKASARSFLHNQVRSMVGSLKLVGDGKWTSRDLADVLAARDRKACGPVAPACGLYLTKADYPD
ncbi:MAG: tRNA pseudouridine(38-40) synthase TruA [Filomicrobium sp.]